MSLFAGASMSLFAGASTLGFCKGFRDLYPNGSPSALLKRSNVHVSRVCTQWSSWYVGWGVPRGGVPRVVPGVYYRGYLAPSTRKARAQPGVLALRALAPSWERPPGVGATHLTPGTSRL